MNAAKYYPQKYFLVYLWPQTCPFFCDSWMHGGAWGQLQLQRKYSKQMPLWIWTAEGGGLLACFHAHSILPCLYLTFAACIALLRYKWTFETHWWKELGSLPVAIAMFPLRVCPGLCMAFINIWAFSYRWEATLQFHDAGTTRKHVSMATPGLPHPTAFRCYWPQKQFFISQM